MSDDQKKTRRAIFKKVACLLHLLTVMALNSTAAVNSSSSNNQPLSERTMPDAQISNTRAGVIIAAVTGVTIANSMTQGLLIVALPQIAEDLHLAENFLSW